MNKGYGDHIKTFKKKGDVNEEEFIRIAKRHGFAASPSVGAQDYAEHWDVSLDSVGAKWKVDVKAQKSLNQSDPAPLKYYTWLEYDNVQGKAGWLRGKADLIAFRTSRSYMLCDRKSLKDYFEHKCGTTKAKVKPWLDAARISEYLHVPYKRRPFYGRERKDKVALFSFHELVQFVVHIWWLK